MIRRKNANFSIRVLRIKFVSIILLGSVLIFTVYAQEIIWLRRFDTGVDEFGIDLKLDNSGNLICVGHLWDTVASRFDILFIKYTPNGDTIWTRYYDGGEVEMPYRIVLDHQGNIIVAGANGNDTIEAQCAVYKFSPMGDFLWQREYRVGYLDNFCDAAVDSADNIYLVGFSYSLTGGGRLVGLMCKYDSAGTLIWSKIYDWSREFYGLSKLTDGTFVATGSDTLGYLVAMKFNADGDTMWVRRYSWGNDDCHGWGITVDHVDNIIATGYIRHGTNYDWGTIKYTAAGETVWSRRVDFTPSDWATDVATDTIGNIYVCGNGGVVDTNDYILAKFDPDGELIWAKFYDNGYDDRVYGVEVDNVGNPIVIGTSYNGTDYDFVTIKYHRTPGIKEDRLKDVPNQISPVCIYPNPAKGEIVIRLPLSRKYQKLKMFDISGKIVKAWDLKVDSIEHSREIRVLVDMVNPGVYLLVIESKDYQAQARLVIVR